MAHTFRLGLDEGDLERDIDGIQIGAVAECPLCLLAWREILKLRQQGTTKKDFRIHRISFNFNNYYKRSRTFYFRILREYTNGPTHVIANEDVRLGLHPLLGLNLQTAQLAAKYEYPPRTDAESVAKLIESWYLQCTTQHPGCASPVSTYQPPRLVEIQKGGFRLIIPSECGVRGSYATLSHCWGNAPDFLKLTSTNMEQLRQWNPTDRLPQTFQDAVRLCCHLHIKYLWIDSLCILQDGEGSISDWSLHVTEMRVVYSNGVLNIAASRAAASNEGMYTFRNPNFVRPAVIQGNNRFGLSNELHLLVNAEFKEPGATRPPLNERGWVFQERILSRRVVHFEREQVFWECNDSALCETYPAGVNETYGRGETIPLFELPTKHNYKLAAFAGIAQHISREFNDDYFAGMFRSQLPMALHWRALDWHWKQDANQLDEYLLVPQSPPDNVYRCPSWTWAKMDTDRARGAHCLHIVDPDSLSKHYVTIHDVKATPVDSKNLFGNLKSAYIILEGRLLPWVKEHEMPDRIGSLFDGKKEACIDPRELFIIPFFAEFQPTRNPDYYVYFLIVHRPGTEKQERYRRVGTATLFRHLRADTDIEERTKGLSTIDEIFEADVVWRKYLSTVEEKRIFLV
ncbi:heterokaryon incompatibility protein-domain-containing protein [Lophiotrema nucula]|uniref:Heterokaryon incompatibility protein-domain-containing protein n=1 Tax=Lophiotrema nucula TaxID=690887 RepID=A0A6A5Z0I9_9PLEO|nr:heterokaryon incompatibility protein-domain-containing protein [Lophiotrema nucula]